ncbi:MAG: hypothetical protein PPP58_00705 [Natronomonas sp.]
MADEDQITQTLTEGSAYEQALIVTHRTFPISLTRKIQLCLGTLLLTTVLAPLLHLSSASIRMVEGEAAAGAGVFRNDISTIVLIGVFVTTVFVAFLIRHETRLERRKDDLTLEEAQHALRIQDMILALATGNGLLFVLVPIALVTAGVSPDVVAWLYDADIRLYQPSGVSVDARITSLCGGVAALGALLYWRT